MVPADHVLAPEADVLPAIVVVKLASGTTHFVVVWRRHGPMVQVMDPGLGRRWLTCKRFVEELYLHEQAVPAADWRDYAARGQFLDTVRQRMRDLGVARSTAKRLIDRGLTDPGWQSLAALDAAVRMTQSLVRSGGLRSGSQATRVLEQFVERNHTIAPNYWSVRPAPGEDGQLLLRGAVMVHASGRQVASADQPSPAPLSPELVAALAEPPSRPGRELLRLLREDGVFGPAALTLALLLATGGVLLEAVLFRGLFDLGRELGLAGQRMGAMAALLGFAAILLLLEFPLAVSVLRWGRRLETRLRIAFLKKIPRLGDRYFQSRLTSDMAERSHSVQRIRNLPNLGGQLMRGFSNCCSLWRGSRGSIPPACRSQPRRRPFRWCCR